MSGGQQPQNTLYEGGIGWAIMLIIAACLIWLFWIYFDVEVRNIVKWIKYGEIWVVHWFIPDDATVSYYNGQRTKEYLYHDFFNQMADIRKEKLNYNFLSTFSEMAMQPLRYPIMVILGLGALWCLFLGPRTSYRRRLDIDGLIKQQSKVFPVVAPFIKFNPSTQPPRPPGAPVPAELPSFAEALGPEEWLAYNMIKVPDGKIDEESAARAFRKQLGRPWRGAGKLDDYKQILLAAFCLKAARKRTQGDDMIGRVALCWEFKTGFNLSKDKKLLKEARAVLKNKELSGSTLSEANKHAFEATAMIRALAYAREEGGVLSASQFVWLRGHDRALWYPLNNFGRQSYHMEAFGAMSHYKSEKITQRPIPVPKVEAAVQAIQEYMSSSRARPIPQLDYSKSKKRGVKKAV